MVTLKSFVEGYVHRNVNALILPWQVHSNDIRLSIQLSCDLTANNCVSQTLPEIVLSTIVQWGLTALHHAALSGEVESIKVLVQELHVDPDICDIVSYMSLAGIFVCCFTCLGGGI